MHTPHKEANKNFTCWFLLINHFYGKAGFGDI